MASAPVIKLPRQISLVLGLFPAGEWSTKLVNLVNQFSFEVVQSFLFALPKYKELAFTTGAAVASSFPIDFPVAQMPIDVWVASINDSGTSAVTVKWQPIVSTNNSLNVRVSFITGLSTSTAYTIRLGYR